MNIGVLVLAAGKSTRISPIARGRPKPLLELGGKRLIEWNLGWLAAYGVRRVWVNLHYRADDVWSALGDGSRYGLEIRYRYEPTILGTAGAWRAVAEEAGGGESGWLVVYGDNVTRFDLGSFFAVHKERGVLASVAVFDPVRHRNTGIAGGHVALGADGRVEAFREGVPPRPKRGEYVNAGVYLLQREVLECVAPGFQDFGRDVFPSIVAGGRVYAHVMEDAGFCLGLDTPESHARARELVEAGGVVLA